MTGRSFNFSPANHGLSKEEEKIDFPSNSMIINSNLALKIAEKYEHLIHERDMDGMTALQLLSSNPSAFKSGSEDSFYDRLFNSMKLFCSSARREAVRKEKQRRESALKLATFLVGRDTSWETTYPGVEQSKPRSHKYVVSSNTSSNEKGGKVAPSIGSLGIGEGEGTPLFLATKSGCVEIVEEIIKSYPQAVEHIDDHGRNILHVAIKYRQLEIFELVTKMKVPMRWLVRKVDNKGNSILHMVGKKRKDYVPEQMQGPAFELQEELHWLERVKKITPSHLVNHKNHKRQIAEGLFTIANNELRHSAKEWLKRTSEGCSIVAVLIATVAFAAAYTIPGGPNQNTGLPLLLYQPFFVVFTATDVLSLTFALTAVVTFLSISTSPFRIENFKDSLPNKLVLGFAFLFLSVSMMMIAFAATLVLMIHNKERWMKIILYATSFLPVGIFALSYLPLYFSLSKTFKYLRKKARQAFPWSNRKSETNPNGFQSTSSQFPATPRATSFHVSNV
ncbi:hypothetical protein L1049_010520 [Liquidambar formosana]|uniref:PGG domain-containing protein n=1 Tax=Liquidambar formosana TaxID=63359 RepID=A0AAP0R769_LIQFO